MLSPIKWVGGKRWHVGMISELCAKQDLLADLLVGRRRFVELFAGGASMSFGLIPKECLLNDSNDRLMNFWRWVQYNTKLPASEMNPVRYFDYRDRFNKRELDHSKQQATLFYALNQWCFNGIYRENQKGEFNVPPRQNIGVLADFDTAPWAAVMRRWTLTRGSYEIVELNPTDVVYADPPYDDGFTSYQALGFDWIDQQALARRLAYHAGPVVLMNKATERVQRMYAELGFTLTLLEAPQRMEFSKGRSEPVLEVMATRNLVDTRDTMGSLCFV